MKSHVLPASLVIALDTFFIEKEEMPDAIDRNIAKWADVFYYEADDDNDSFKDDPYVFLHQEIIHEFVTTIHHLVRDKNITALEIVTAVYTEDKTSSAYRPLIQCHENYLDKLDKVILKSEVFTGKPEQKQTLEDAVMRKDENRDLLQNMVLNFEDRLELDGMAKYVDNKLFADKATWLMSFAADKNYKPFGYDKSTL